MSSQCCRDGDELIIPEHYRLVVWGMGRSFTKYTTCILVHLLTFNGGIFGRSLLGDSVASSVKWEMIISKLSEAEPVFSKILPCFIREEKKKLRFSVPGKGEEGAKESWSLSFFQFLGFGQVDGVFVDVSVIVKTMGMTFCHRMG